MCTRNCLIDSGRDSNSVSYLLKVIDRICCRYSVIFMICIFLQFWGCTLKSLMLFPEPWISFFFSIHCLWCMFQRRMTCSFQVDKNYIYIMTWGRVVSVIYEISLSDLSRAMRIWMAHNHQPFLWYKTEWFPYLCS